jgi:NhaP-type Na+/H+ or K+/H+ antiporter
MMLIEGILVAFIFELAKGHGDGLGELSASIQMWSMIDPHLLLFAFVPALLFGDAMALDTHIFFKCLTQCLVLAGPGVLVGTFVTGACAKFILPYGWGWELSLIFGSILSATDPVAVVALLKSLGASPTLTMQITGESLLNDGTAVVVFTLFFNMYHDATKTEYQIYTPFGIIAFFARLALGGVALGTAFGLVTVWFVQRASHKTKPEDSTTQLLLTLCCAYLSFYVGEEICGVSGILTNVSAALVLSKYGWPSFCDSHAMHVVWHAFETIGNTLIFLLAGLIIGESIWEGHNGSQILGFRDWGYMFIFFGLMTAIRAGMILLAFPILQRTGYGTTFADAFFMTWGGLRGAIGLALAMIVKQSINVEDGQRIIFLVGTLATCTLLINGTTRSVCAPSSLTALPGLYVHPSH